MSRNDAESKLAELEAGCLLDPFDLIEMPIRVKAQEVKSLSEVQRPRDEVRVNHVL
jgi:hypothetical protein